MKNNAKIIEHVTIASVIFDSVTGTQTQWEKEEIICFIFHCYSFPLNAVSYVDLYYFTQYLLFWLQEPLFLKFMYMFWLIYRYIYITVAYYKKNKNGILPLRNVVKYSIAKEVFNSQCDYSVIHRHFRVLCMLGNVLGVGWIRNIIVSSPVEEIKYSRYIHLLVWLSEIIVNLSKYD